MTETENNIPPAGAAGGGSGDLHGRAWVAAEYRVAGSPHEWTDENALAMARFILAGPAPTPDLGAQGEPVAWPASYQATFNAILAATRIAGGGTAISVSVADFYRALALEAPSAPRPSSAVTVKGIAALAKCSIHSVSDGEKGRYRVQIGCPDLATAQDLREALDHIRKGIREGGGADAP